MLSSSIIGPHGELSDKLHWLEFILSHGSDSEALGPRVVELELGIENI